MAEMTSDEKVAQLNHFSPSVLNWSAVTAPWNSTGWGAMTIESTPNPGAAGCNVSCRIANLRQFQQAAVARTRLAIPLTFVIETSHCGAAGGTIFPMGVAQGATWNASLVQAVAAAIADEGWSWGGSRGLSPEINVVTDQRFGRTEENFGEDPQHVAVLTTAAVTGLQGGVGSPATDYLPPKALVAEAKHMVAGSFSFNQYARNQREHFPCSWCMASTATTAVPRISRPRRCMTCTCARGAPSLRWASA